MELFELSPAAIEWIKNLHSNIWWDCSVYPYTIQSPSQTSPPQAPPLKSQGISQFGVSNSTVREWLA